MSNFTVVYDACVLYPAPLRDLLMELALTDLFHARWSEEIHREWIRSVLKNNTKLTESQLLRTKDFMDANVRDALVTGFESLIPSLTLPDMNDRHVLAAAIRCQADAIVTFNLKDFPSDYLSGNWVKTSPFTGTFQERVLTLLVGEPAQQLCMRYD